MKYKENSKENQLFYYKKEETLTHHQHGRFMQNLKLKRQVEPKLNEKEQIVKISQISTHTSHQSKEPSSKKTAGRSQ